MTRQEEKWLLEFAEKSGCDLDSLLKRRESGEPLQYILGEWEFYGYNLKVGAGVLVPRPETEFLVDLAKEHETDLVLDLCAGTGCVGIALARETNCNVICVEISEEAIFFLKQNIELNGVSDKVKIIKGDILNPEFVDNFFNNQLPTVNNQLSIVNCQLSIVVNPPYLTKIEMDELQKELTFEPRIALFGGCDGLDFYRKVFTLWGGKLKADELFATEVGYKQAAQVYELMENAGFEPRIKKDYSGIERIIYGFKNKENHNAQKRSN
ncbi:MAG: peptide chain release factor N(5)-glutamine methyltransferase [Oscillospiraceae bacterium]|nr:peptide chain release factor N(5)-glutamine methyltransferase [Oscillospiraceae bacterium]